jgi:hypothetical protein
MSGSPDRMPHQNEQVSRSVYLATGIVSVAGIIYGYNLPGVAGGCARPFRFAAARDRVRIERACNGGEASWPGASTR